MAPADQRIPALFKWFESTRVAASGRPQDRAQLEFVADQGITHIISTATAVPDQQTIAELGMTCVHIPGVHKDLDALDRAVDEMKAAYDRNEPFLIH